MILIDLSRTARRVGRIYVVRTEDGLVAKRASRDRFGWHLSSDHPVWEPVP